MSAVQKISRVTKLPDGLKLYRGLGGMILPRQFWEHYSECQVTFTVAVNGAAATVLLAVRPLLPISSCR